MAKHVSYLDFDLDQTITCSCGHEFVARKGMELYSELADITCGRCRTMLYIIGFPTVDEVKRGAAAGNPRAQSELQHFLEIERFQERFKSLKLKSADELPELEGERLAFKWGFTRESTPDGRWTVISCGDVEVWREPAVYEGTNRFEDVKSLLKERYGARFVSLTPTLGSELYLYGDHYREVSTT